MNRNGLVKFAFILLVLILTNCASNNSVKMVRPEKIAENIATLKTDVLIEKVTRTPLLILQYLSNLDQRDYQDYPLNSQERDLVSNVFNQLPISYQKIISERVIGIYFIKDFLGSGLTDFAFDKNGKIFTYMVFNANLLSMNLEEWLNWKEMTCFQNENKNHSIKIKAGKDIPAFLGILLHETTHTIDYTERITPFVEDFFYDYYLEKNQTLTQSLFTSGVWKSYHQPENRFDFPDRTNVTFYGLSKGPKIPISKAKEAYDGLDATPFVSLYGSQSWAEDLAETAAFYYLTQKYHSVYQLSIFSNNIEIAHYQPALKALFLKRTLPFFTNNNE